MSAVARQAHPWGIACGVLFDFLCEDGFLVVFCCHLLPLLSPGCVGGGINRRFSVLQEGKKPKRGLRGPSAGSTGLARQEKQGGKEGEERKKEGEGGRRVEKL